VTVHTAGDRPIRRAGGSAVDRGKLQYSEKTSPIMTSTTDILRSECGGTREGKLTFKHRNFLLNFSTPCIQNANNTGTKKGSIMK